MLQFVLPEDAPAALIGDCLEGDERRTPRCVIAMPGRCWPRSSAIQDGLAVEAYAEPLGQRVLRFATRNEVLLWLLGAYAAVRFLLFFLRDV